MGHSGPGGFYRSVHKIKEHLDFLCCGAERGTEQRQLQVPLRPACPLKTTTAEETVWSDLRAAQKRSFLSLCGRDLMLENELRSISRRSSAVNLCSRAEYKCANDRQTRKDSMRGYASGQRMWVLLCFLFFFLLVYDQSQHGGDVRVRSHPRPPGSCCSVQKLQSEKLKPQNLLGYS